MTPDPIRVLLVEDNPGDAKLVAVMLRDAPAPGFRLARAGTIGEALGALHREAFDVILLDLNLPDSSGLEGLATLLADGVTAPIVVLTGLDDEGVGAEALRRHAADFLVKGEIDTSSLTRSIRYSIERARAEDELRLQRTALVTAANAIVMTRADGTILWANPAFTKLTGYSAQEAIGRNPRLLKSGRQDAAFYKALWETLLAGHAWQGELVNRRKDGRLYTEEMTITPVRGASGAITHFIAIKQDVTDRARADAALRDSEEKYRALFSEMTEGFALHRIICDEQGQPADYRFLEVNPAFERLTGLRGEDILGRTHKEVLPEDDPTWVRTYGEVALTGVPARFDQYSPALGRHYEVVAYRPAPLQVAVVFTDVSDRKRREEELRRLNRTLLAHTKSDQALVRAADEATYLGAVCRVVVEDCGHAMVWIGLAEEDEGKSVRPVAHSGFDHGYLDALGVTWAETERGRGPTGTAIRTCRPIVCRNMTTDAAFAPWREQALARGYASSLAIPLMEDGKAFGALTIYSRAPDPFSDDEIALLVSLADDLAYGISVIRMRDANARAEVALRQSEERYRTLVEMSPEAVLVSRADRIEFANPAAVDLFGAESADQLVGRSPFDLFPLDLHARMRERIGALRAGQTIPAVDSKILRLDGSLRDVAAAAGPVAGAGGPAAQIILRDITERKRIENELRETRDYLEKLFDHANAPIVVWDPAYRITRFNRAFERLTGRRAADVVGQPLDLLFPAGRRAEAYGHIRRTEAGEYWETVEIPILRIDRTVRTVLWNSAPLFDESGGNLVATIAQGHDITERKRAEAERERLLREVEDERTKLRTVIETAPEGIVFTDPDALVLVANPAARRVLGDAARPGARVEGRGDLQLCHADASPFEPRDVPITRAALDGEVSSQVELLTLRSDGDRRSLLVSAAPVRDSQGQRAGAVGVLQDITVRKRTEEELRVALAQARRQEIERAALLHAARTVLEKRAFDAAAGTVLASCKATIGAGAGFVLLLTSDGKATRVVHFDAGESDGTVPGDTPMPLRGLRERVLTTRKTVVDNAFGASPGAELLPAGHVALESALLAPMAVGGEVVGFLGLANKPGGFTPDDARLASAFAEMAALSHLNTRTLELLERNQAVLETQVAERTGQLEQLNRALLDEIAERKLTEAELRSSQQEVLAERQRLFGLLEELPIFVFLRGPDNMVRFANRYFREQFGDPQGKRCFELLGAGRSPCAGCRAAKVLETNAPAHFEWISPDERAFQVHNYPFVDFDGAKLVLELGIDVTELRHAIDAEHRARQAADTLREGSLALTRNLELDAVLTALLEHLRWLVPYDRARVMVLEGASSLTVRAAVDGDDGGPMTELDQRRFDANDNPVIGDVLSTGEAAVIPDMHAHPHWGEHMDPSYAHSWMGVPLQARGRVVGMFSVSKYETGFFTRDHLRLAEALSAQASAAIENALLFEEVQHARERLQTLSRRLVEVQEGERRTIARELHDEAGQSLTALLFGLRLLEREPGDAAAVSARAGDLKRTAEEVLENLHRLAANLRPASLDHLGLEPAMRQHLDSIERTYGLTVRFKALGLDGERLPPVVETTLYRVVQEALTNVVRHAKASSVDVLAERRGGRVMVMVEDDGVGFDAERAATSGQLGLLGMRERAETLGGTLNIESTPSSGTTVVVEVPCGDSNPAV